MKHRCLILIAVFFACACLLQAQTPNAGPLSAETQRAYNSIRDNLMKAAEKMPEQDYAFKPTPEIRSFGEMIAHIADAQTGMCSAAAGSMKRGDASSKKTKAELVDALKSSSAECDAAFGSLTDANVSEMVKMGSREMTKLGLLWRIIAHDNESYGYIAVYLRLKGVVPPSSEGR